MVSNIRATTSVIVVDDHAIFRMGVMQTLALSSAINVVGEGASCDDAIALMSQYEPDIALIDISMPGNGFEAAGQILRQWPATRVVLLTASEEDEDVYRGLKLGASGYILKGISARELIFAVETIASGETFLSPSLAVRLLDVLRSSSNTATTHLSHQETRVLGCLVSGMSNSDIATALGISLKTVKFHLTNIFAKTGTKSRVQLALMARDLAGGQPRRR
jgi:two-component system nitrate/nitrite response regulator NarL